MNYVIYRSLSYGCLYMCIKCIRVLISARVYNAYIYMYIIHVWVNINLQYHISFWCDLSTVTIISDSVIFLHIKRCLHIHVYHTCIGEYQFAIPHILLMWSVYCDHYQWQCDMSSYKEIWLLLTQIRFVFHKKNNRIATTWLIFAVDLDLSKGSWISRGCLNIKMPSDQYRDPIVKWNTLPCYITPVICQISG